ncbi:PPP2R5D [Acrasis kona]|uniref:PPP2R5D n=1 Tax=Acrasis kona TaxID=1008807 RepID=A0AAW2ZP75_9EUKA
MSHNVLSTNAQGGQNEEYCERFASGAQRPHKRVSIISQLNQELEVSLKEPCVTGLLPIMKKLTNAQHVNGLNTFPIHEKVLSHLPLLDCSPHLEDLMQYVRFCIRCDNLRVMDSALQYLKNVTCHESPITDIIPPLQGDILEVMVSHRQEYIHKDEIHCKRVHICAKILSCANTLDLSQVSRDFVDKINCNDWRSSELLSVLLFYIIDAENQLHLNAYVSFIVYKFSFMVFQCMSKETTMILLDCVDDLVSNQKIHHLTHLQLYSLVDSMLQSCLFCNDHSLAIKALELAVRFTIPYNNTNLMRNVLRKHIDACLGILNDVVINNDYQLSHCIQFVRLCLDPTVMESNAWYATLTKIIPKIMEPHHIQTRVQFYKVLLTLFTSENQSDNNSYFEDLIHVIMPNVTRDLLCVLDDEDACHTIVLTIKFIWELEHSCEEWHDMFIKSYSIEMFDSLWKYANKGLFTSPPDAIAETLRLLFKLCNYQLDGHIQHRLLTPDFISAICELQILHYDFIHNDPDVLLGIEHLFVHIAGGQVPHKAGRFVINIIQQIDKLRFTQRNNVALQRRLYLLMHTLAQNA